jgi:hypothetical protein
MPRQAHSVSHSGVGGGGLQDFEGQQVSAVLTQMCGFVTILGGVWLLHATKDHDSAAAKQTELDSCQADRRLSDLVRAKSAVV